MVEKINAIDLPDEVVADKIYLIRNQKVMLDRDLAGLYEVTTSNLNKAVSRNLKRFPGDFMFQLNDDEFKNLIFQYGTSRWGGTRKKPYAFTEQGVAMLSGILTSDRAIAVNIQIMRIFIRFRNMLNDHTELKLEIEKIKSHLTNHDKNMELVFQYLDDLLDKSKLSEPRRTIGYKIPVKK